MRDRSDVIQEVLILSDGRSNCGGDATVAAKSLHNTADVYAIMIGNHTPDGMDELTSYVSAPSHEHLFALDNYSQLKELVDLIQAALPNIDCAPFDLS